MRWIYFFATAATLFFGASCQNDCPRVCRCDRRRSVYCNERQMDLIPYGIPVDTQTLHLQINNITNGLITDEILSSLKQLTKLDLHQNQLTSVPKGLPSSLEYIDFRNNDIRYVGKTSLSGLTSLVELHLDGNNIANKGLSPFAFQDSHELNMLVLSNNLLTEFPENLPPSLRILRLENNCIQHISAKATRNLGYLINLDLSLNAIAQTAIEPGALAAMMSLVSIDLSHNHLTEIPQDLPDSLQELMLSNNQIDFIFNNENSRHGSLTTLQNLNRVDFSSNNIKSVQISSFAYLDLDSVALHDNPWQCDCHLRYFKQWLNSDESTLSSESNIRCHSPTEFSGVTLNSIDEEALVCESRLKAREMMTIVDVTPSGFTLLWKGSRETPDPDFIKRSLMYGPLRCRNCSIEEFSVFDRWNQGVVPHLEKYSSQDITLDLQKDPFNASVKVNRLQSNNHYAVCVFDSEQNDDDVTLNQCLDFWTTTELASPNYQEDVVFLPLWLIVLCCVVVLVLLIAIIGVIAWRKRNALKSKTPRTYLSNRDEHFYPPTSQLPGFPSVAYRQASLAHGYGTAMTDRTYAECGPASSTVPRTLRDSAIDARMEFEVLLKPDDTTAPKRVHTPMSSLDRWVELFCLTVSLSYLR